MIEHTIIRKMEWLEGQKGRKLKWQESKMKGTWQEDQKKKETNRKGNFMSWAYQIGSWKIQKLNAGNVNTVAM